MSNLVRVQIISWERRVGVRYDYADGRSEAHEVGPEDWPVIRHWRRAGHLSYRTDEVRAGMDEIFRLGLDRARKK